VRGICERYGLPYNSGPLGKQFGSVVTKICRLALPDGKQDSSPPPARELQEQVAELQTA
jgi:hypothetical protein